MTFRHGGFILTVVASYTLNELADRTRIQARTIRSYIEQGLLPGPDTVGRNASYTENHVHRLRAIRVLKDLRGMSLAEVRRLLMAMSEEEIRQIATGPAVAAPVPASAPPTFETFFGAVPRAPRTERVSSPVERAAERLEEAAGQTAPRRARAQHWIHIEVTPDVELRIRGALTPEQLSAWERIADQLRQILMGGD